MQLAIWDTPPAEFFASGLTSGAVASPFEVVRMRPEVCAARLLEGKVEAALLPATMALQGAGGLDVVPGVAVSSWAYPFARLVLKGGLREAPQQVVYDRRAVQERHIAQIVLAEHYRFEPVFEPLEAPATEELLAADAALIVGSEAATLQPGRLALDLGQEWFELAKYPMVWGLLAARRDTLSPEAAQALVDAVYAAEAQRAIWLRAQEMPEALHAFFRESLRLRFDDLVTASLTELKEYLFYYDVLDEIPSLSYAALPEKENDEEEPLI